MVLERCWRGFGEVLERFWRGFGEVLERFWKGFGEVLEGHPGFHRPEFQVQPTKVPHPGFHRPGFHRPGFHRAGFHHPGFQRPGFQRPGFTDPPPRPPSRRLGMYRGGPRGRNSAPRNFLEFRHPASLSSYIFVTQMRMRYFVVAQRISIHFKEFQRKFNAFQRNFNDI